MAVKRRISLWFLVSLFLINFLPTPAHAKPDVVNTTECERDLDEFSKIKEGTSESFRHRITLMDQAQKHCEGLENGAVYLMMALDAKMKAGIQNTGSILPAGQLLKQISETSTLQGRIKLIHDHLSYGLTAITAMEAASQPLQQKPAVSDLVVALRKLPVPSPPGFADAHFTILIDLLRRQGMDRRGIDLTPVSDFFIAAYTPEQLSEQEAIQIAQLFVHDGRVTEPEWNYIWKKHTKAACYSCLRIVLKAKDHGSQEIRTKRILQALAYAPANPSYSQLGRFQSFFPMEDVGYFLAIEKQLPESLTQQFDWNFYERMLSSYPAVTADGSELPPPSPEQRAFLARAVQVLSRKPPGGLDKEYCFEMEGNIYPLRAKDPKINLRPLYPRICECYDPGQKFAEDIIVTPSFANLIKDLDLECKQKLLERVGR